MRSLAVAVLAIVSACGGGGAATVGPYEQTWSMSYAETTCVHWADEMDDHQRFVMASDMLAGARTSDGAGELAPEQMQRSFQAAIDGVCQAEGREIAMKVSEVAAFLYVGSSDFKP